MERKFIAFVLVVLGVALSLSSAKADSVPPPAWSGDLFFGYTRTSGNTDNASGTLSASLNKKVEKNFYLLKGNLFYAETNKKMDTQKWDILAKFTRDFGKDDKYFSFYQVLVDHDYFADIDYRVTPAAGLGWHIAKGDEFLWDVDAGLGYRVTRYRMHSELDDETITAIGHTYLKKKVFTSAYISEDFTIYPGLESGSAIVFRSETAFTNPLSKQLDLELKFIVDYNSEPAQDKTSTDRQFVVGVKYKF